MCKTVNLSNLHLQRGTDLVFPAGTRPVLFRGM